MQEGAAVVFEQLDVYNVNPCIIGILHHFLIDFCQRIHRAVGAAAAHALIVFDSIHDGVQLFGHGFVLVIAGTGNVRIELDSGVVAHHKRSVQGVVISQKTDFMTAGADILTKNDFLRKISLNGNFNISDGYLKRDFHTD